MHRSNKAVWECPISLDGTGKSGRSFLVVPCFYKGKALRDQRTGAFTCSGTFFPIATLDRPVRRWFFTREQKGSTMVVVVYSNTAGENRSSWLIWATKDENGYRIDTQTIGAYIQMPCLLPAEDDRVKAINAFCNGNVAVALRPSWDVQQTPKVAAVKRQDKRPVDAPKTEPVRLALTAQQNAALQNALDAEVCASVSMTPDEVEDFLDLGLKPGTEEVIPQFLLMKINRRLAKKGLLLKSGTRIGESGLEVYYSLVKRTKLEDTRKPISKKQKQTTLQDFSQVELVL